jgi:hydroxymethylpyrimidine/phosphomethylpyrimidine kinase
VDLNQVTLPCTDYEASVRFYKALGLSQIVDSPPRYARFETDTGATLSIHSVESRPDGSDIVVYFEVPDVDREVRKLKDLGLSFETDPADQQWLWREAYLRDPAGNLLCIFHAGDNRRFPPWRIREDSTS